MPYRIGDLRRKVHDVVAASLAAGQRVNRGWVIHDILSRHPLMPLSDREFNLLCRRDAVGRAVRDVLATLKVQAEDPEEVAGKGTLPLPGFKHLQLGYPFKLADGSIEIVPLALMTPAQMLERAELYDRMAAGCIEHAAELRRYAASRRAA